MLALRLPVSGARVVVRPPAGSEDLMLAEATNPGPALALALVRALATAAEGELDWSELPITDIDVLLIRLRQWLIGDFVRADVYCPSEACGAAADLNLRLSEYLSHHAPRPVRGVERSQQAGWYRAVDLGIEFRVPSGADLLAFSDERASPDGIAKRCVRAEAISAAQRRRLDRLMDAIAPCLYGELAASCSECGRAFGVYFDPQRFVLRELMGRAVACYEEIHLIASAYHWSEQEILRLPLARRARYAAFAARDRGN